jgi:uncharacterized RDD family membrane protein YckC
MVVTTGRIGAHAGRFVFSPARVVARSPLAEPFRGRAERLAETGRTAEFDARRRLEAVAGDVLATPEAEEVIDGVFAGALPEAVARSLVEHRVVERIVAEALERAELDRAIVPARESERTEQQLARVLASPSLERALADTLDSRLTVELTEKLVQSEAFRAALASVLSSPEVRTALKGQSSSLVEEIAAALRARARSSDDRLERAPRRWFRRPLRPQGVPVASAGVGSRGIALAVDAALVAFIFFTGAAVVDLVVRLVWRPRPASLVDTLLVVAAVLVEVLYFAGFWSTAGQTPGMRLLGVRVVDRTGAVPGLGRSLLRVAGLALAILVFFTGFLPALVDGRRRALQDFLAGTVVVYDEDEPVSAAG